MAERDGRHQMVGHKCLSHGFGGTKHLKWGRREETGSVELTGCQHVQMLLQGK